MKIQVNGQGVEVADGATVADALAAYGAPEAGIAVAVDGEVLSRGSWATTPVPVGAAIDVVTAVQGG
ncbi:MAG: sulfur carrier protein ThiS [Streptosporangiales bacterium]|nr:sulfur carrier protein ThiS [Streptosporangiales bacterium]